jgi:hypothetical protein
MCAPRREGIGSAVVISNRFALLVEKDVAMHSRLPAAAVWSKRISKCRLLFGDKVGGNFSLAGRLRFRLQGALHPLDSQE